VNYFPHKQRHWLFLAFICFSVSLQADECEVTSDVCIATDSWQASIALGGGAIRNPLNGGSTIPLFLLPSVSYYGEQFYLENTELGYTLSESQNYAFSLTAGLNSEAAYFYRWHPSNVLTPSSYQGTGNSIETDKTSESPADVISSDGQEDMSPPLTDTPTVPADNDNDNEPDTSIPSISINDVQKREWAADGGARLHLFTDWGIWQLHGVTDVTNTHNGYQLNLNYQQQFITHNWSHVLTLGGSYKSENLVDYYYGVDSQDQVDPRLHYQGKGSINPYARWFVDKEIDKNWHFISWFGVQHLGEGISNSPLVTKSTSINTFIGFSYKVL